MSDRPKRGFFYYVMLLFIIGTVCITIMLITGIRVPFFAVDTLETVSNNSNIVDHTITPTITITPSLTPAPTITPTPTPNGTLTQYSVNITQANLEYEETMNEVSSFKLWIDAGVYEIEAISIAEAAATQRALDSLEQQIQLLQTKGAFTSTPTPQPTPNIQETEYYTTMQEISIENAQNEANRKGNILGVVIILVTLFVIMCSIAIMIIKNYYKRLFEEDDDENEEDYESDQSQSNQQTFPGILQGISRGDFSRAKSIWRQQINDDKRSNRAIERAIWNKEGGIYAKRVKLITDFLETPSLSVYSYSDFIDWVRLTLGSQSQVAQD